MAESGNIMLSERCQTPKIHILHLCKMPGKSKSIETESRLAVAWDWEWELTVFRHDRCFWDDENALKLWQSLHTLVNLLK